MIQPSTNGPEILFAANVRRTLNWKTRIANSPGNQFKIAGQTKRLTGKGRGPQHGRKLGHGVQGKSTNHSQRPVLTASTIQSSKPTREKEDPRSKTIESSEIPGSNATKYHPQFQVWKPWSIHQAEDDTATPTTVPIYSEISTRGNNYTKLTAKASQPSWLPQLPASQHSRFRLCSEKTYQGRSKPLKQRWKRSWDSSSYQSYISANIKRWPQVYN